MTKKIFFVLASFAFLLTACDRRSEYQKLIEQELATGVRHDSLFFGIHIGMTSKDFYTHCWELNKQGLFREGPGNTTVLHELKNELKYPAQMTFYPEFCDEKICEMPVTFMYEGWAPWNKNLFSDKLQADVLQLLKKWYGDDFIRIPRSGSDKGDLYVKVDGNRRIALGRISDSEVKVQFSDLTAQAAKVPVVRKE